MVRRFLPPHKRPFIKMCYFHHNGKVLFQVEFGFPLIESYLFIPFMGI